MNDGQRSIATASQTIGPFFHVGLAKNEALGQVAPEGTPGERIRLRIRVLDGDGAAVPDALVEVYQADDAGRYGQAPFGGFGRLPTGEDGSCVFDTIRPGAVALGVQAPHVNVCLFARGLLRHVCTRIYFAGDVGIDSDPLMTVVPAERRQTLLAAPAAGERGTWEFIVRLQGEDETVFFDV